MLTSGSILSRRKFLFGAGAGAVALGAYMRGVEPRWLERVRQRVPFFNTPSAAPLRVLVLTDFHYSRNVSLATIAHAVETGLAQKPDLVLLGGDFVLFNTKLDDAAYAKTLAARASAPVPPRLSL
jgi:predicted MPP superfamily phosphohydrolase